MADDPVMSFVLGAAVSWGTMWAANKFLNGAPVCQPQPTAPPQGSSSVPAGQLIPSTGSGSTGLLPYNNPLCGNNGELGNYLYYAVGPVAGMLVTGFDGWGMLGASTPIVALLVFAGLWTGD